MYFVSINICIYGLQNYWLFLKYKRILDPFQDRKPYGFIIYQQFMVANLQIVSKTGIQTYRLIPCGKIKNKMPTDTLEIMTKRHTFAADFDKKIVKVGII